MKALKKIVVGVLTAVVSLVSLVGCTDKQAGLEYDEYKESVNNVVEVPVDEDKPSVADFDGQIVRTGGAYNFSKNMAFLGSDLVRTTSTTTEDAFTESSVTVTATVYPADANQNVDWWVEFMNASSTWATGKSVTDYVSVTTETAGSTTATVTCKRPFAEQIKLVCTSQENAEISDYRTIDFVQAVKSVSLTFGDDLPINFGGETSVPWEVNPNGISVGGDANVQIEMYQDYTLVDNTYTWECDMIDPTYFETGEWNTSWGAEIYQDGSWYMSVEDDSFFDGKMKFKSDKSFHFYIGPYGDVYNLDLGVCSVFNITKLNFDSQFITSSYLSCIYQTGGVGAQIYNYRKTLDFIFSDLDEMCTQLNSSMQENSLYCLRFFVRGTKNTYEYTSLIKVSEFTNKPVVKSVTLGDNVIF